MKHDTSTLILAAEVRRLARKMREQAMTSATSNQRAALEAVRSADDAAYGAAKEALAAASREWLAAHPLSEFVAPAMAALESVADIITQARE